MNLYVVRLVLITNDVNGTRVILGILIYHDQHDFIIEKAPFISRDKGMYKSCEKLTSSVPFRYEISVSHTPTEKWNWSSSLTLNKSTSSLTDSQQERQWCGCDRNCWHGKSVAWQIIRFGTAPHGLEKSKSWGRYVRSHRVWDNSMSPTPCPFALLCFSIPKHMTRTYLPLLSLTTSNTPCLTNPVSSCLPLLIAKLHAITLNIKRNPNILTSIKHLNRMCQLISMGYGSTFRYIK